MKMLLQLSWVSTNEIGKGFRIACVHFWTCQNTRSWLQIYKVIQLCKLLTRSVFGVRGKAVWYKTTFSEFRVLSCPLSSVDLEVLDKNSVCFLGKSVNTGHQRLPLSHSFSTAQKLTFNLWIAVFLMLSRVARTFIAGWQGSWRDY